MCICVRVRVFPALLDHVCVTSVVKGVSLVAVSGWGPGPSKSQPGGQPGKLAIPSTFPGALILMAQSVCPEATWGSSGHLPQHPVVQ